MQRCIKQQHHCCENSGSQKHQQWLPCREDHVQRVGPDHLHQHDKDKIGDQIADDLHQQLQNVVDLLDGLGHHFRLSAQHQQRHAHGGAQQDDLQRVALQERTDDIRGEEVQHHAEKTVELRSTAPPCHTRCRSKKGMHARMLRVQMRYIMAIKCRIIRLPIRPKVDMSPMP